MSDLPIPHDREEVILNAIATGHAINCPEPHSRKEIYLKEIYENGGGSGGSGMTPEQVESIIEANTDLSLSDISTNPVSNKAVTKAFEGYVAKVDGKDLSSNDYSDSEKQKVEDNSSNILMLRSESGHSINVTLDKSTYVMTVSLLNEAGEVLNSKTVDFPMETAFVNASYDKASKTMKFTLESGSTVDVPLGDLVEGLVSQTDFDVLRGEVESNTNAISVINSNLDVNVMIGKYPDTKTIQNVTFTKISDGKYKVVGTNSATYGALCRCSVFTALANVEYKVNVSGDSSNCRIGADNISESVWIGIKPNGSTFKFDSDTIVSVYIEVIGGATVDSTIEFSVTTKNVGVEVSNINSEVIDLKMLGWTVPRECPIQNSVSSNIFTQRVGRVDLGILNWSKDSNSGHERFVTTTLKGTINPNTTDNNGLFKGFCTKYTIDSANGTYLHSSDKTIASDSDGNIWVYDSSYNDKNADDFKNSLKGVYLYYELATPITMTIDGNEAVECSNYFGELVHKKGEFYQAKGISSDDGKLISASNYDCYWMIPIEPNTNYYNTMNRAFYWYDENKTFIRSTSDGLSPSNARYLSIDFKAGADVKVYKGLYADSISDINDSLSVLGKCKNLLKPTLGSGTGNGITYVNNGDGSFTLSGTCTNTFELHFNSTLKLPYGKYKLLGTSAFQKDNNGAWKATLASGDVFEVSESKPVLDVIAYITSGSVVDKTFKPMVTANLNATEDDFVPYTGDGDTLTEDVAEMKNDVDNKYIDTFYLGSNSSTTFDISDRVKSRYPIMIMLYPVDDQPGIWNYVGVIMPSSLDIHIVTLNSSNIEVTMDSNYIITVKNTNGDWGTHFKMRLI